MKVRRGAHKANQFVRIDRKVAGVLAAEVRFLGSVLQEVAGHPMIFT